MPAWQRVLENLHRIEVASGEEPGGESIILWTFTGGHVNRGEVQEPFGGDRSALVELERRGLIGVRMTANTVVVWLTVAGYRHLQALPSVNERNASVAAPDLLLVHEELLEILVDFEAVEPPAERGSEILLLKVNGGTILHRPGHRDQFDRPWSQLEHLADEGMIRLSPTAKGSVIAYITPAGYRHIEELRRPAADSVSRGQGKDVFISYASEDRAVVDRLTAALDKRGVTYWRDQVEIRIGDSINQSIDKGIAHSRFGVPVLSASYFAKSWPQRELDGLVQLEAAGTGFRVLPIWHGVSSADVLQYSPTLAGKRARSTKTTSYDAIADEIADVIKGDRAAWRAQIPRAATEPGEILPDAPAPAPGLPERATVAIHWVGQGTGMSTPGHPADPLLTQFVTASQARELLGQRSEAGDPLFELGRAPDHDPEAQRDLRDARRAMASHVAAGQELETELGGLVDEELLAMHSIYWEQRVTAWDRDASASVTARIPGWRPIVSPGSVRVENRPEWRDMLLAFLADRMGLFSTILRRVGTQHVGYVPRVADPSTVFTTTINGRQVELRATDEGQITPRNKDEVRALDNAGFAPIEVPLEVVMHLEPRWLSGDRTQVEKTVITLAAELERTARGGRVDHAVLNHMRKRINAFQRHPSALSDDDVHALAHDITEAIRGGRRP